MEEIMEDPETRTAEWVENVLRKKQELAHNPIYQSLMREERETAGHHPAAGDFQMLRFQRSPTQDRDAGDSKNRPVLHRASKNLLPGFSTANASEKQLEKKEKQRKKEEKNRKKREEKRKKEKVKGDEKRKDGKDDKKKKKDENDNEDEDGEEETEDEEKNEKSKRKPKKTDDKDPKKKRGKKDLEKGDGEDNEGEDNFDGPAVEEKFKKHGWRWYGFIIFMLVFILLLILIGCHIISAFEQIEEKKDVD